MFVYLVCDFALSYFRVVLLLYLVFMCLFCVSWSVFSLRFYFLSLITVVFIIAVAFIFTPLLLIVSFFVFYLVVLLGLCCVVCVSFGLVFVCFSHCFCLVFG